MAKHIKTGQIGETLARQYLEKQGYHIVAQNWCYGKKEVDLIVSTAEWIVFVEVKSRNGIAFGFPEEAVTLSKQNYLRAAADEWLYLNNCHKKVRFDIISIIFKGKDLQELLHIEDAFF